MHYESIRKHKILKYIHLSFNWKYLFTTTSGNLTNDSKSVLSSSTRVMLKRFRNPVVRNTELISLHI